MISTATLLLLGGFLIPVFKSSTPLGHLPKENTAQVSQVTPSSSPVNFEPRMELEYFSEYPVYSVADRVEKKQTIQVAIYKAILKDPDTLQQKVVHIPLIRRSSKKGSLYL